MNTYSSIVLNNNLDTINILLNLIHSYFEKNKSLSFIENTDYCRSLSVRNDYFESYIKENLGSSASLTFRPYTRFGRLKFDIHYNNHQLTFVSKINAIKENNKLYPDDNADCFKFELTKICVPCKLHRFFYHFYLQSHEVALYFMGSCVLNSKQKDQQAVAGIFKYGFDIDFFKLRDAYNKEIFDVLLSNSTFSEFVDEYYLNHDIKLNISSSLEHLKVDIHTISLK